MRRPALARTAVWLVCVGESLFSPHPATSDIAQTTQSLGVQLQAVGKLSVPATLTLLPTGSGFAVFQATLPLTFRVRSSPGGNANINLQVTSDFVPAGGPSAAAGVLTYTCSGSDLGAACAGIQSATPVAQTPVLSIPGSACTGGGPPCSSADPNIVQLNFLLDNDPSYATGSYSAQVLFTISAT